MGVHPQIPNPASNQQTYPGLGNQGGYPNQNGYIGYPGQNGQLGPQFGNNFPGQGFQGPQTAFGVGQGFNGQQFPGQPQSQFNPGYNGQLNQGYNGQLTGLSNNGQGVSAASSSQNWLSSALANSPLAGLFSGFSRKLSNDTDVPKTAKGLFDGIQGNNWPAIRFPVSNTVTLTFGFLPPLPILPNFLPNIFPNMGLGIEVRPVPKPPTPANINGINVGNQGTVPNLGQNAGILQVGQQGQSVQTGMNIPNPVIPQTQTAKSDTQNASVI